MDSDNADPLNPWWQEYPWITFGVLPILCLFVYPTLSGNFRFWTWFNHTRDQPGSAQPSPVLARNVPGPPDPQRDQEARDEQLKQENDRRRDEARRQALLHGTWNDDPTVPLNSEDKVWWARLLEPVVIGNPGRLTIMEKAFRDYDDDVYQRRVKTLFSWRTWAPFLLWGLIASAIVGVTMSVPVRSLWVKENSRLHDRRELELLAREMSFSGPLFHEISGLQSRESPAKMIEKIRMTRESMENNLAKLPETTELADVRLELKRYLSHVNSTKHAINRYFTSSPRPGNLSDAIRKLTVEGSITLQDLQNFRRLNASVAKGGAHIDYLVNSAHGELAALDENLVELGKVADSTAENRKKSPSYKPLRDLARNAKGARWNLAPVKKHFEDVREKIDKERLRIQRDRAAFVALWKEEDRIAKEEERSKRRASYF